jgi:pimeloyl-ACP methyl ester carboxylesterase
MSGMTLRTAKCGMPSQDEARFSVLLTSTHKIEADGVQVFYRAAGDISAPVILLLHGFPASSFMFRELIPRLANDYRVITPDLPGFGSPTCCRNGTIHTPLINWRSRSTLSRGRSVSGKKLGVLLVSVDGMRSKARSFGRIP